MTIDEVRAPTGMAMGLKDQVLRHGLVMALNIGDLHGEEAERAWFREHEALPLHDVTDCPMRLRISL